MQPQQHTNLSNMEYSSPLAAMRPQPCHPWERRKDLPMGRSVYSSYQTYGPSNFNFKDLSMQPQRPLQRDYFTLRPARGSSPTASLTADLDANFHIDKRYSTFLASALQRPRCSHLYTVRKPRRHGDRSSRPTCSALVMKLVSDCH